MFGGTIPATVEWVLEKAGLQLYSAGITPAKGGPCLNLGANYPYQREGVTPLTEEESDAIRIRVQEQLLKSGYKSKVNLAVYHDCEIDHNDFRLRVILKETDVNPEKYALIKKLWRERRSLNEI